MPKILIPTPLRRYAGGAKEVETPGATVGEALASLTAQHADLRKHLYTDEGRLRSFVNIYLNDEDIRYLDREATAVTGSDAISIVPSIAGGAVTAMDPVTLSAGEIRRYSRHLIMPEVGMDGQLKLKQAKVLLVGTGGLGSPLALYLAAAGVGTLGLVDFDVVDDSNLQRQVIHGTKDLGKKKLDSAIETLSDLNPHVTLVRHDVPLTSENALEIAGNYDIVADGTDNFPTRYLVNDACVLLGKPNVYGSIFRFEGQASVFATEEGPCYRCLYPEPPPPGLVPSCAEGGVLGILPGVIGLIQATEVVKLILGAGETLKGRLMLYDALAMKFRELKLRRDPDCPPGQPCSKIKGLIDYQEFCGIPKRPVPPADIPETTPVEVKARLDRGEAFQFIDVREIHEHQICHIEGARLVPLGDLPKRLDELDRAAEVVVHCKSGARSAKAAALLRENGFTRVVNLKGGILAWSDTVDPSVPKY